MRSTGYLPLKELFGTLIPVETARLPLALRGRWIMVQMPMVNGLVVKVIENTVCRIPVRFAANVRTQSSLPLRSKLITRYLQVLLPTGKTVYFSENASAGPMYRVFF